MPSIYVNKDNKFLSVHYPVREQEQKITDAEYWAVRSMEKIPAIKFLRGQYGLGLLEAKNLVDVITAYSPSPAYE